MQGIECAHFELGSGADHGAAVPGGSHLHSPCVSSCPLHQLQNGDEAHHLGQARHLPLLVVSLTAKSSTLTHLVHHPTLCRYFGHVRAL